MSTLDKILYFGVGLSLCIGFIIYFPFWIISKIKSQLLQSRIEREYKKVVVSINKRFN